MNDDKLPNGINNAYIFQALNAVSFNIALGSPLILFARELGASAAVLGILSGFTPLLSTLQLVAIPFGERWGWRALMLRGWGGRVSALLLLAMIPLIVGLVPPGVPELLVLGSMFLFNFLRGFAAGAWLPIISAIVPRSIRGAYLTRDRAGQAIAAMLALGVSGLMLSLNLGMLGYGIIFGSSFLTGVISLHFLNRVPYAPPTQQALARA